MIALVTDWTQKKDVFTNHWSDKRSPFKLQMYL